jgi:hypothetical protein
LRFFLALLLSLPLFAEEFILENEGVLLDKSVDKIVEMTSELKAKTGVGIYISAIKKLEANETIGIFANKTAAVLKPPYVLLVASQIDEQITALISPDLQKEIDKDDILCVTPGCPILPIVVGGHKDVGKEQAISAGFFNGVAYIADAIADKRGVVLESSVGSGSKNFGVGITWVVRIMIILTLVGLFLAWRRGKKEGK